MIYHISTYTHLHTYQEGPRRPEQGGVGAADGAARPRSPHEPEPGAGCLGHDGQAGLPLYICYRERECVCVCVRERECVCVAQAAWDMMVKQGCLFTYATHTHTHTYREREKERKKQTHTHTHTHTHSLTHTHTHSHTHGITANYQQMLRTRQILGYSTTFINNSQVVCVFEREREREHAQLAGHARRAQQA